MNIKCTIEAHEEAIGNLKETCIPTIEAIANICRQAIRNGHKILFCGNGGSAADSQHLAAEFVGRFVKERRGLPAIALTTDTSILTAVGNDYGYNDVFRRQVEALGNKGDVIIGISTSGNSGNVVEAFTQAKQQGLHVIAFTGPKDSKMSALAEVALQVPAPVTARVQECHILVGHMICEYVDGDY
jgi:D-sedoheptulose 7-phosphate isomerase